MLITDFTQVPNFLFVIGSSSSEIGTKAQLESIRRSYKITQEAKITRHLFASHNNVGDIEKIMQDEQINNMSKLNLEDFQNFDTQLKTDLELIKKLVKLLLKLQFYFIDKSVNFLEMFYVDKH